MFFPVKSLAHVLIAGIAFGHVAQGLVVPKAVIADDDSSDLAVAAADAQARPVSSTPTSLAWPTPTKAYTSSKCTPLVRKSWRKLSTTEKSNYIKAVQCLAKNNTSVTNIAGAKSLFDDFQGTHSIQTPNIHWVGHFVLWHRYFVAAYEYALRYQCDYEGAQPFWDWEYDNASGLDVSRWAVFDPNTGFGGNGPYVDGPNPFGIPERSGGGCVANGPFVASKFKVNLGPQDSIAYNPRCLTRDFSRPLLKWGSQANINWVWDTSDYGWFTKRLENEPSFAIPNIHGGGHFGVGGALGTMGDAYNSPGDPLFYLHHTNLDRIFWQWQWQTKNLPGSIQKVSGPITPFDYTNAISGNVTLDFKIDLGHPYTAVTLKELLNTQGNTLCYTYAKP